MIITLNFVISKYYINLHQNSKQKKLLKQHHYEKSNIQLSTVHF